MSKATPIAVANGDGIGPEIMAATLHILQEAGARIEIETAPVTTPQGGGFKSINVTNRKTLGLSANVRTCVSYDPFVETKHPKMDVVIVRENEEDQYAGVDDQLAQDIMETLKLISRPGCERIVRYAFECALQHGRKVVTCFTKDNIMKMSDGLFHKVFDQISAEDPSVEKEHRIVDIGTAKMADTPEAFDVVVMPNLYGDILSDVAAQIAGSVGLAGSSIAVAKTEGLRSCDGKPGHSLAQGQ
jgi:isocitrate dehydrogenase